MDTDKRNEYKKVFFYKRKNGNNITFPVQFFSAIRIRWTVRNDNELNRFLLDYGCNFLPYIGFISYIIFLIEKI
jgi:hypothetical protein